MYLLFNHLTHQTEVTYISYAELIDPVEALILIVLNGLYCVDVGIHKYTFCSAASTERLLYRGTPVSPVIQFKVPFAYVFLIAVWEDEDIK